MRCLLSAILPKLQRKTISIVTPILTLTLLSSKVSAHCPLCTAGIAAAAGGAAFLGVKTTVIGLFVGAFAFSMGSWIGNIRKYGWLQKLILGLASYLITILPLAPMMNGVLPVYISVSGDYGSMLNRTYLFNGFVVGSLIGGMTAMMSPWLSNKIIDIRRGKRVAFQGVLLTLLLLIAVGIVIQGLVWEITI